MNLVSLSMFFKRKKDKNTNKPVYIKQRKLKLKPLSYPPKVIVAWGEAISGNQKIRDWLMKNGFPELGMFCFALRNDFKAKEWLMNNGYPHLNALISGAEGDERATRWLLDMGFPVLNKMALSIEGDQDAYKWLFEHDRLFYGITKRMEVIKDQIQDDNVDYHKINP